MLLRRKVNEKRVHSSRMRTDRALTVFRSLLLPGGWGGGGTCLVKGGGVWSRGVSAPGGWGGCLVPGGVWSGGYLPGAGGSTCLVGGGTCLVPGGTCLVPGGASGPGGCVWSWGGTCLARGGAWLGTPPPVNRMTDRCKNITLAKTSFRPVKITSLLYGLCFRITIPCARLLCT